MKKTTIVPPSKTPVTVTIDIPDPVPTLKGTTIGFTQADPTITQTGGTAIDPVPVPIPDSDNIIFQMQDTDYARPGAGANNFYGGNGSQTPLPFPMLDNDTRFLWPELQTSFASLDAAINKMIAIGGKLSFRVTTFDPDKKAFPSTVPAFSGNQPDFNSEAYLSQYEKFVASMADHLKTTDSAKKGVRLIQGVYKVDIGGIGKWSEMHFDGIKTGIITAPSGIRIINAYTSNFPDTWLMITISGLTNNSGLPVELAKALLSARNNRGPVGIRCDHFGWIETFKFDMTSSKYWSADMLQTVKDRSKTSPVCGELMNTLSGIDSANPYSDLSTELKQIGGSQFSNNNYARTIDSATNKPRGTAAQIAASDLNIIAASKIAGARIGITSAIISNGILTLKWLNAGIAPVYENWEVWLILNGQLVKSEIDNLRGLLPGSGESSDTLPAGTTSISVIIKDPDGYRSPYPLMNTGRGADGSYKII